MTNEERLKKLPTEDFAAWVCMRSFCPPRRLRCPKTDSLDRCIRCWTYWLEEDDAGCSGLLM